MDDLKSKDNKNLSLMEDSSVNISKNHPESDKIKTKLESELQKSKDQFSSTARCIIV